MLHKISRVLANVSRLPEIFGCYRETRQWRSVILAYLGFGELHYPYALRLRSGETLTLQEHSDLVIFWLVFVRGHYPVRRGDRVILDIGANIGLFTIYAARQAPSSRVIAVEPFPDTCERLHRHIDENNVSNRVIVLNCAVAAERGRGAMDSAGGIPSQYRRIDSADTAMLNAKHRGVAALENLHDVEVEQKTLSDILEMLGGDVDLLKMNIHGSEYSVLMSTPGKALQRLHRLAVQYHEFPAAAHVGKSQLFSYLGGSGFQLLLDRDTRRGAGLAVLAHISAPQSW